MTYKANYTIRTSACYYPSIFDTTKTIIQAISNMYLNRDNCTCSMYLIKPFILELMVHGFTKMPVS